MTKINWKEEGGLNCKISCGDWVQITYEDGDFALLLYVRIDQGKYKLIKVEDGSANRYYSLTFNESTIDSRTIERMASNRVKLIEKVGVEINVIEE